MAAWNDSGCLISVISSCSVGTSTYFLYSSKSTSNRRKSYSSTHKKMYLKYKYKQTKQMYLKYRQKYINKSQTKQLNFSQNARQKQ